MSGLGCGSLWNYWVVWMIQYTWVKANVILRHFWRDDFLVYTILLDGIIQLDVIWEINFSVWL